MISKKEADKFLSDITDTKQLFARDAHKENEELLQSLVYNFHQKVPFQNITLLAKDIGTQDIPSVSEVFSDVLSKRGGLCYTNNVFLKYLLQVYDLKVNHVAATCNIKHPNNHIMTSIEGLVHSTSLHIADVGCGYPTYQLLNFSNTLEESKIHKSGFLKFKFINSENGSEYERLHFMDYKTDREVPICNTWEKYYSFTFESKNLDFFKKPMEEVYKDRFLRKLRALVFNGDDMYVIKESGSSAVQLIITPSGTEMIQLNSNEEIANALSQMLPVLPRDTIINAIHNWIKFKQL